MLGNISFARIISHFKKDDITARGSGNPGTFNMIRSFGLKLGLVTLLLDVIKGAIPALIGYLAFGGVDGIQSTIALYACGLATVTGHIYPIIYKFKGGKGVASTLGVFMVASPLATVVVFFVAFWELWFFDYGSVFSFICLTAMLTIGLISNWGDLTVCLLITAIYLLVMFAHRQNIYRLLNGKENKANLKKALFKTK